MGLYPDICMESGDLSVFGEIFTLLNICPGLSVNCTCPIEGVSGHMRIFFMTL